jgi:hypothetical protein
VLRVKVRVGNAGKSATVKTVTVTMSSLDTLSFIGLVAQLSYGDLAPGQQSDGTAAQGLKIQPTCPPNTKVRLLLRISSLGFQAWTDTLNILVQAAATDAKENSEVPRQCLLSQNYPNPFNPATNFEFRVSSFEFVSFKIFDALGREVATLVDETKAPGIYRMRWEAGTLPSGIYFYRMTAGSFTETKKLILLR